MEKPARTPSIALLSAGLVFIYPAGAEGNKGQVNKANTRVRLVLRRSPEKGVRARTGGFAARPGKRGGPTRCEEAIATVRSAGVGYIAQAMLPKLLSPESVKKPDLVERVTRIMNRPGAATGRVNPNP